MSHPGPIAIEPLGDRAFFARFDREADARAWVEAVRLAGLAGVTDVVLSYETAAVFADPDLVDIDLLGHELCAIVSRAPEGSTGRLLRIPVLYDGDDLDDVAGRLGLSSRAVVARHAGVEYTVFAVGFLPGFPYAGYLPDTLRGLPRRPSPRTSVPAGSVALAGKQTGIYPSQSPGGWHLIGRTPLRIADPDQGYFPIRAGDRLRFETVGPDEYGRLLGERLERSPDT